jgi:hypothetical protein
MTPTPRRTAELLLLLLALLLLVLLLRLLVLLLALVLGHRGLLGRREDVRVACCDPAPT